MGSSCTRASNTLPHCHATERGVLRRESTRINVLSHYESMCCLITNRCAVSLRIDVLSHYESMCCLITFTVGIQQMCSHPLAIRRDLCGLSAGRARTACNQLRAHLLPRIDSTTRYFACRVTGCFTWSTLKMEEGGARVTVRVSHINACNY
jgi:hypothetical protein